ncbi:lipid A biosynthesis acyltransferase, partial [Sphingobacterium shayense]|nr:lipid A biosynthesis acyltransferase [Sphingobacterium shayense]
MGTKRLFQTVAYKALYGVAYGLSLLPMVVVYSLASIIFFFAYYIGYRKAVVIQNIARSFPEKRYGEIQAIVKKFYACFVVYFAEILKAISASKSVLENKIVFENL